MTFLTKQVPAALLALALGAFSAPPAAAGPKSEELSGTVVAEAGGKEIHLPLLKAGYRVEIDGDIAHVELTQTFLNPTRLPLNATYLFPMNQKAAVHAMRMDLDGESIVARIRKKAEAEATFEAAKREGKAAALLTQHRPNMFTQDIANLMPGRPVTVTLDYVQSIPKIDGAYELVVPMVVGPRYEGASVDVSRLPAGSGMSLKPGDDDRAPVKADPVRAVTADTPGNWRIDRLPAYPPVIGQNAPDEVDPKRVTLDLSLRAPMPVSALWSDTHALEVKGDAIKSVRFSSGAAIDNKDFVLRYQLAAEREVAAGVASHFEAERGGTFSLLIQPPIAPAEDMIGKRELVFVLDTSGSMGGAPMEASKIFMRAAIEALRPDDTFRILRFSNNTSQFAREAVRATPHNKAKAQRFVRSLNASGGTEIDRAVNAAFDLDQQKNTTRIVVFLSDGYIGDERSVISTIANRIGNARIYAFGVGNAVNRFLLDAMAEEGRGFARYIAVDEDAKAAAEDLATRLKTPLLTDISIDWNGLEVSGLTPSRIPDLFEGGSVRVMGRYQTGGRHTIHIDGVVNGHAARLPLEVDLKASPVSGERSSQALPLIWAREQIFAKNRAYTIGGSSDKRLENEITDLGLTYSLQTRFTSFVAVSERVVNAAPETALNKAVPLPQVSGVTANAYPSLNLSGSSAPEPEGVVGLMLVVLALAARFRRGLRRAMLRTVGNLRRNRTRSRTANRHPVDPALPRSLRRDGWWLEA